MKTVNWTRQLLRIQNEITKVLEGVIHLLSNRKNILLWHQEAIITSVSQLNLEGPNGVNIIHKVERTTTGAFYIRRVKAIAVLARRNHLKVLTRRPTNSLSKTIRKFKKILLVSRLSIARVGIGVENRL